MGPGDRVTILFMIGFGALQVLLLALLLLGGIGVRRRKGPAPVTDAKDAMTRG
jgi:hypothetical protein